MEHFKLHNPSDAGLQHYTNQERIAISTDRSTFTNVKEFSKEGIIAVWADPETATTNSGQTDHEHFWLAKIVMIKRRENELFVNYYDFNPDNNTYTLTPGKWVATIKPFQVILFPVRISQQRRIWQCDAIRLQRSILQRDFQQQRLQGVSL